MSRKIKENLNICLENLNKGCKKINFQSRHLNIYIVTIFLKMN